MKDDKQKRPPLALPPSTEDVPVRTPHINKNTFIQVILEQVFFSSFFYTQKNYKNLQKAPLNRPVATGNRSGRLHENNYLVYLL